MHFWQIWRCWFVIWQSLSKILAQKYPNKTILVPSLGISLQKFQVSNMTILFSNSNLKAPKSSTFGPKVKDFHFYIKLCNKANLRALISNMTIVFQNCCLKHPNKTFFIIDLRVFIFPWNFVFLKKLTYPFQIPAQNYPQKTSFCPKFIHFCFCTKFEGTDLRYDNSIFKFMCKNTQIKDFYFKFKDLHFWTNFLN